MNNDKFDIKNYLSGEKIRKGLFSYLKSVNKINLKENINELMSLEDGFIDRFDYFVPFIKKDYKNRILISGCLIGGEMIEAKKYGFREIFGTEINRKYVDIASKGLATEQCFHVDFYDGKILPYSNEFFGTICSGHIIEHTPSPFKYLKEHLRVLKRGGIFFIEFPNRYYKTELHTNLFSFEWLPKIIRNLVLKIISSKIFFTNLPNKHLYFTIYKTLSPVSIWQIRVYLAIISWKSKIIDVKRPHPGYIRMIIQK